jgi:4'-phosphopantetheinyl transferase
MRFLLPEVTRLGEMAPEVFIFDLDSWPEAPEHPDADSAYLDAAERSAAAKLRVPQARQRFIRRRILLRRLLAQQTGVPPEAINYETNRCGKPRLAPAGHGVQLHFNASHSGSAYAVALWRQSPVGIDIEAMKRRVDHGHLLAAAAREHERATILAGPAHDLGRLAMRLWVVKEALLKAAGTGLQTDPRSIDCPAEVFSGNDVSLETSFTTPEGTFCARLAVTERGGLAIAVAWPVRAGPSETVVAQGRQL